MTNQCQRTKDGEPSCNNPAVPNGIYCRRHGGYSQSSRQRRRELAAAADGAITEALQNPDLMDVRRPVAMSEVLLRETPVIATPEMVEIHARRRIARDFGPDLVKLWKTQIYKEGQENEEAGSAMFEALMDLLEPDQGDLDLSTLELHDKSQVLIERHGRRQVEAVKALEWARTMRDAALPLLQELSIQIGAIFRKHVAPELVPAAIEDLQQAITRTIGKLAETGK